MFHPSFTYTHGLQTVMILGGLQAGYKKSKKEKKADSHMET